MVAISPFIQRALIGAKRTNAAIRLFPFAHKRKGHYGATSVRRMKRAAVVHQHRTDQDMVNRFPYPPVAVGASLSAINVENQQITKRTPNFTPKNVKLGVFILFKNNVEHLQSFDEIKHRHTLNEVGDVAEGKDKHYCNSRFLLTRFNSVLQFMYH